MTDTDWPYGETENEWLARNAYVEWEDRWFLDFTEEGWEAEADAQATCSAELLSGGTVPC